MTVEDPLAPGSEARDRFAGPVAAITLLTATPEKTEAFYSDLAGLSRDVPAAPTDPAVARGLWGLPDDLAYRETIYRRAGEPRVPVLRVLEASTGASTIRPGHDAMLEGGLSIGFAVRDMNALIQAGHARGFDTTAGRVALELARSDGSPYEVAECHFKAPDDVYALGVERPPDLAQVAPIATNEPVGGPAYTGQVMNHCDRTLAFYTEVLGYEVRRRVSLSGPQLEAGLGLPEGTSLEFLQVFAPGSSTGYFIVLDFGDAGSSNDTLAPPHRGVVGWTIPVKNAGIVAERAAVGNASVIAGPLRCHSPVWGDHFAVSVRTANGFIVECVQIA